MIVLHTTETFESNYRVLWLGPDACARVSWVIWAGCSGVLVGGTEATPHLDCSKTLSSTSGVTCEPQIRMWCQGSCQKWRSVLAWQEICTVLSFCTAVRLLWVHSTVCQHCLFVGNKLVFCWTLETEGWEEREKCGHGSQRAVQGTEQEKGRDGGRETLNNKLRRFWSLELVLKRLELGHSPSFPFLWTPQLCITSFKMCAISNSSLLPSWAERCIELINVQGLCNPILVA